MLGVLSAGIAPGVALLSYFYLKDEYGVEPIKTVFRAFLSGFLIVFPIMFVQYIANQESMITTPFIEAFVTSSLLEEFGKWFLMFYIVYQHVDFDEPYDGIVYGAAVSLGFATLENIFYLIAFGLEQAIVRALLPVSSHALFGVIMGYYIGKLKFSSTKKPRLLIFSLLMPVLLHGIYDFILITQEKWLNYMIPFMIILWLVGLWKVKKGHQLSTIYYSEKQNKHLNI